MGDSWQESAIRRKDFRHTANGPEVPTKYKSKVKNTRRWCKGVVGREHVLILRLSALGNMRVGRNRVTCGPSPWYRDPDNWGCTHERACEVCGKVMQWDLGKACPDRPADV